jgi:hypothetical protein
VDIDSINADGSGFQHILTDLDAINYIRFVPASVPEPASLTLVVFGAVSLFVYRAFRAGCRKAGLAKL